MNFREEMDKFNLSEKDKFLFEKMLDATVNADLALQVLMNLTELLVRKGVITNTEAGELTGSRSNLDLLKAGVEKIKETK